ncbi:hypothetical protein COLSTE_00107 [Collinsella stercoris DSM 13279]|uniref:Uncharacterized protein n=1 Tax=Collinsella stercoris DSM 13279 TaxID=445975 RepID=B6G7R7_9ACTN|nr:hypothetical protein COLSTE_00107 [Collinsella stercoris DSM 13279]
MRQHVALSAPGAPGTFGRSYRLRGAVVPDGETLTDMAVGLPARGHGRTR